MSLPQVPFEGEYNRTSFEYSTITHNAFVIRLGNLSMELTLLCLTPAVVTLATAPNNSLPLLTARPWK